MANIIRVTTPTIRYTFDKVAVSDLTEAYLTIQMNGETVLEKSLAEAEAGTKSLSWTLTQEETLSLSRSQVKMQLNWLTAAGLRGASEVSLVHIDTNLKNEVIT